MPNTDRLRAIWIVRNYPHPTDPIPGIFFRTQARALVRASVDVDVIAPTPFAPVPLPALSRRWRRYHTAPPEQRDEGVRIVRPRYLATPRQLASGIPHVFMARSVASAMRDRSVDVVHGHYPYPEGIVAQGVARKLGVPAVLTLHGSDVNVFPTVSPRTRDRFERAILGCDEVLAVSEALAARTEDLTGRRPLTAPIGVDLRPYDALPGRGRAREMLGLPATAFLVLFVGRLDAAKGIHELLEALRAPGLEDVWTVFVGDGPLAQRVRASDRTVAVGEVANDRVPLYLAAADLLVLPSYREGTPTVVVEAGAAGTPVVATDVGGTSALLEGDRGYLMQPRSGPALARALVEARTNWEGTMARAARLRSFIEEHHSADASARRLRDLYLRLATRLRP